MPVAPADGATVAGPNITLEWTGGPAQYKVELAFDREFKHIIKTRSPLIAEDACLTLSGVNGGYIYWRVHSADCELEGLKMPPIAPVMNGGYEYPELVHVDSRDRWAVAYRIHDVEPDIRAWVTLFDDEAGVIDSADLLGSTEVGTAAHSIKYNVATEQIITSNDVTRSSNDWTTYVHVFDGDLSSAGSPIVAAQGLKGANVYATDAAVLDLPGLLGNSALVSYRYREQPGLDGPLRLMIQRVDLSTGKLAWGLSTSFSDITGQEIVSDMPGHSPIPQMAWNPVDGIVGLSYTQRNVGDPDHSDVYFVTLDPLTARKGLRTTHLNSSAPGQAIARRPQIEWDGEEFLVLWEEQRDHETPASRELRMTKFDRSGMTMGAGESLYRHEGSYSDISPASRAIIGHDRIHAMVYSHQDGGADTRGLWLCIEPPYE